jgi:hypothetical protein
MKPLIQLKTTTLRLLIPMALICFALLPNAQAISPRPDGGYAGFNTAEGQLAGFNATTGSNNVYIGSGMNGVAGREQRLLHR